MTGVAGGPASRAAMGGRSELDAAARPLRRGRGRVRLGRGRRMDRGGRRARAGGHCRRSSRAWSRAGERRESGSSSSCRRPVELSRLAALPIPILHLYFNRRLPRRAGRAGRPVRSSARARVHRHLADVGGNRGGNRARALCLGSERASRHGVGGRRDDDAPRAARTTWTSIPAAAGASRRRSIGSAPGTTPTPTRSCSSTRSAPTPGARLCDATSSRTSASWATSAAARSG